jgi:S-adenosylmethionine:tRNA ribosyltransferase-isomerase
VDVSDFDFDLPPDLIAQTPAADRSGSRLLHLDRQTGAVAHSSVGSLPHFLRAGDLVVVNNTRVFPARLLGHRVPSGGAVECLLVRRFPSSEITLWKDRRSDIDADERSDRNSDRGFDDGSDRDSNHRSDFESDQRSDFDSDRHELDSDRQVWEALVHPGQKLHPGARMVFEGVRTVHAEVLEQRFFGRRVVRLWTGDGSPIDEAVDAIGHTPLPPYIKRGDDLADRDRYQTVFARDRGSIAAPTAGLHFTPALVAALEAAGVHLAQITLHVGYGTFQPVRVDRVEDHRVEAERFAIDTAAADAINAALDEGRRVIAVGTTTTRTLEAVARESGGRIIAGGGSTDLFIYPGFQFRVIGGLVTNFHLPRSSLLMLVSAFAGRERVLNAYRAAIDARYRFYSYGDAMLIT